MKEKDIHELIEQQDPEAKQRIWEKIQCVLNEYVKQNANADESKLDNNEKNSSKQNNPQIKGTVASI